MPGCLMDGRDGQRFPRFGVFTREVELFASTLEQQHHGVRTVVPERRCHDGRLTELKIEQPLKLSRHRSTSTVSGSRSKRTMPGVGPAAAPRPAPVPPSRSEPVLPPHSRKTRDRHATILSAPPQHRRRCSWPVAPRPRGIRARVPHERGSHRQTRQSHRASSHPPRKRIAGAAFPGRTGFRWHAVARKARWPHAASTRLVYPPATRCPQSVAGQPRECCSRRRSQLESTAQPIRLRGPKRTSHRVYLSLANRSGSR